MDASIRKRQRRGEATWRDLARLGLCAIRPWDGNGHGYGRGCGNGGGNGNGYGYGNGNGYGHGNGGGHGSGNGNGNGSGNGNGYGHGCGDGDGDGNGLGGQVDYTAFIKVGTPIVVRSYTTGVVVGRLAGGEGGTIALTAWRWLREWQGVGGTGSVYDLAISSVVPQSRGPFTAESMILQQADAFVIDETVYERLARDEN